eukprot:TRINITY_DN93844_c0_g1_i1.p1 TRINITY_DN93844_c0_g1~~TRINITY_DN93844_c0_g1_i1.p1  ORF type:complete len:199 (-),score=37.19 TRINITY_DN93844_c0_g1_i1:151-747(-)
MAPRRSRSYAWTWLTLVAVGSLFLSSLRAFTTPRLSCAASADSRGALHGATLCKNAQQLGAANRPAKRGSAAGRRAEGSAEAQTNDLLGGAGIFASLVVAWSEYTLKTTGCGLPAGPLGLLGATEGISYLVVVGLLAYAVYSKLQPGKREWGTLLEVGSGLSVLAVVAGLIVFYFQIQDYGYVPEAVPTEGGRCSDIG